MNSPVSPGVLGWMQICDMFVASGETCMWGHVEGHGYLIGRHSHVITHGGGTGCGNRQHAFTDVDLEPHVDTDADTQGEGRKHKHMCLCTHEDRLCRLIWGLVNCAQSIWEQNADDRFRVKGMFMASRRQCETHTLALVH